MSWKHTDFTTTLTHLRMDRGCEVVFLTSPAYLPRRDTQTDCVSLDQTHPISQEGCENSALPSTLLLILLGRMNS